MVSSSRMLSISSKDSKITSMVQLGSEAIVNGNKLESYIIDTEKLYESIMMR